MTVPSTLLQELEENAAALEAAARYGEAMGMPSDDVLRRAAALRARAERVRELDIVAAANKDGRTSLSDLDRARISMFNALTGPLPNPPGTGSGGR